MQKVLEMIIESLTQKLDDAKAMFGLAGNSAQKTARAAEIKKIEESLQSMVVMMKQKVKNSDIQLGDLKNALKHLESLNLRDDINKFSDDVFTSFDLYPKSNDDLKQVIVDLYNGGYAPNDPKRLTIYDDSRIAAHLANQQVNPGVYNQFKEDVALKFVEDDYPQSGITKTFEDIKNTVLDEDGYRIHPDDIKSNIVDIKTGEKLPDKTVGTNAPERVTPAYLFGKPTEAQQQADIDFFKGMDEISEKSAQPIGDPLKAEYIDSGAADTMSFEEFVIKKNKGELATGGRVGLQNGGTPEFADIKSEMLPAQVTQAGAQPQSAVDLLNSYDGMSNFQVEQSLTPAPTVGLSGYTPPQTQLGYQAQQQLLQPYNQTPARPHPNFFQPLNNGGRVGFSSGNTVDRHPDTIKKSMYDQIHGDDAKKRRYQELGIEDGMGYASASYIPGTDSYGASRAAQVAAYNAASPETRNLIWNTPIHDSQRGSMDIDYNKKKALWEAEKNKDRIYRQTMLDSKLIAEGATPIGQNWGLPGANVAQADMSFVDMINEVLDDQPIPVKRPAQPLVQEKELSPLDTESEEDRFRRLGSEKFVSSQDVMKLQSELDEKGIYEDYKHEIAPYIYNGHGSNTLFDSLLGI